MAEGLNKAILIGNLGADPELRFTQGGQAVMSLRLATSESYVDKNRERQTRTEWHRVTVWGPLAGICEQYIRKGSKVAITGRIETRKWQDQSGQDRYTTEIVLRGPQAELEMLDSKQGGGREDTSPAAQEQYAQQQTADLDDEIPF